MRRIALLAAATLALAGCARPPREFACPRLAEFRYRVDDRIGALSGGGAAAGGAAAGGAGVGSAAAQGIAPAMVPLMSAMARALARPNAVAPETRPRTVLVLSGGGPWGAFGAGFLNGWSGSAAHPRPRAFDLVTGVSTGALQATDAFLGAGEDGALTQAYTIARERDLIERRGLVAGALAGSFAATRPLEARVRAALAPLYARVAAEAAKGRLLLVGAVDALDGRMYAIDLTRIARTLAGQERADCYTGALLASAAVPVEFDQVRLGGRPWFDGGVRRSVFVTDIQSAAAHTVAGGGVPGRLYILVNGDPAAAPIARLKPGLVPTLARLRTLAVNEIEVSSIAAVARAAPPGFETYIATAEGQPCGPDDAGHDAVFDPAFMRCLIADGRARWRGRDPWTRFAGVGDAAGRGGAAPRVR